MWKKFSLVSMLLLGVGSTCLGANGDLLIAGKTIAGTLNLESSISPSSYIDGRYNANSLKQTFGETYKNVGNLMLYTVDNDLTAYTPTPNPGDNTYQGNGLSSIVFGPEAAAHYYDSPPYTSWGTTNSQSKDLHALVGLVRQNNSIGYPAKGVSGVVSLGYQDGYGVATNEFHVIGQGAGIPSQLVGVMADVISDFDSGPANGYYDCFYALNAGTGDVRAAYMMYSSGAGLFQAGLDMSNASICTGGAGIKMGASEGSDHSGSKILFDSGDWLSYDRTSNGFNFVIGNAAQASLNIATAGTSVVGTMGVSSTLGCGGALTVGTGGGANKVIYFAGAGQDLIDDSETNVIKLKTNNTLRMSVHNLGVTVAGDFSASGDITGNSCCADYVFDKDYALPSLDELEEFVQTNNHLPGMTINKGGVISVLKGIEELLVKVEEQSRYIMELHNRVKQLEEGE